MRDSTRRTGPRPRGRVLVVAAALLLASGAGGRAETTALSHENAPAGGGEAGRPAERIVSLVPSVTETLFALGAGDRLVAVSAFCDYPEEARRLPRAGSYLHPSVETVVALEPDVVIGVPTPGNQAAIETLRRLGVNVVLVGEDTIADAWAAIRTIGDLIGKRAEAEALVARVERRIDAVRRRAERVPSRRVLFVIGHDPLVVVGRGPFIDELIGLAGGTNVGAVSGLEWPRLSLEAVVATAPDVIIDGAMGNEASDVLAEYWSTYASVPAVREGRVRAHRSEALLRPGPRLGEAAEEMFALIHGEPGSGS